MNERWIGVLVLVGALGASSGCDSMKKGYEKGFKESFVKEFETSCVKGATAQGAAAEPVKALCSCTGKYLIDHHSSTELTKLSAQAQSPEFQQAIKEATTSCMAGGAAGSAAPAAPAAP